MDSLLAQIQSAMVAGIESVLTEKKKKFKSPLPITPRMVETYLTKHGWEKGELETNGWQYDWWLHFTKDDKKFTAFGCGYDGRFEFFPYEE